MPRKFTLKNAMLLASRRNLRVVFPKMDDWSLDGMARLVLIGAMPCLIDLLDVNYQLLISQAESDQKQERVDTALIARYKASQVQALSTMLNKFVKELMHDDEDDIREANQDAAQLVEVGQDVAHAEPSIPAN